MMLTLSQRKTLDFIEFYITNNDYSPTVAEIALGIGITSRGVVHRYLRALEKAGKIELLPKRHRNIRIISENEAAKELPLMGSIAAGRPIEAIGEQESISVADVFLGENRYALRVKGDSMIEEGIFDGDIIVCESSDTAENGQIVVALVDQQEATLKRLQRNSDQKTISLLPANQRLEPMVYSADRVQVQGIYIGLIRYT